MNDEQISLYARRVLGFAYTKTSDTYLAEELSQEILAQFAAALQRRQDIDDLDGYVYSICRYTWAKYARGFKQSRMFVGLDAAADAAAPESLANEVELREMAQRLRRELAYLAEIHRRVTVMFYYDSMTGSEIAQTLGLPQGTVRWHLSSARKKLKEGFEMNEQTIYEPRRMYVGIAGSGNDDGTLGGTNLGTDMLVKNIALVCYGEPLTVEEIARKLTVAAVYIESSLERLTNMGYLRIVGKNKYQTVFYIEEPRHRLLSCKYAYENIAPYAKRIWDEFEARFERIIDIGFTGCDLDCNFLRWALLPRVVGALRDHLPFHNVEFPKRPDGSAHFAVGQIIDEDYIENQTEFSAEVLKFEHDSYSNGVKMFNDGARCGMQVENRITMDDAGLGWRDFGDDDLAKIERIAELSASDTEPSELEKLMIAKFVKDGYAEMQGGRVRLLIPYFTEPQTEKLYEIYNEIWRELTYEFFIPYVDGFAKEFIKEIPQFLPQNVREFHAHNNAGMDLPVLTWLFYEGLLKRPDKENAKRLATFVWRYAEQ